MMDASVDVPPDSAMPSFPEHIVSAGSENVDVQLAVDCDSGIGSSDNQSGTHIMIGPSSKIPTSQASSYLLNTCSGTDMLLDTEMIMHDTTSNIVQDQDYLLTGHADQDKNSENAVDIVNSNTSNSGRDSNLISFVCNEHLNTHDTSDVQLPEYVMGTCTVDYLEKVQNITGIDKVTAHPRDTCNTIMTETAACTVSTSNSSEICKDQFDPWANFSTTAISDTSNETSQTPEVIYRPATGEELADSLGTSEEVDLSVPKNGIAESQFSPKILTENVPDGESFNQVVVAKNKCDEGGEIHTIDHCDTNFESGQIPDSTTSNNHMSDATESLHGPADNTESSSLYILPDTCIKVSKAGKKHKNNILAYSDQSLCMNVMKLLKVQREHGQFCDVVLNVHGFQYWAHRCILSANSSYFRVLLKNLHGQLSSGAGVEQITLPCGNRAALEEILDYMYTGQLYVSLETVDNILLLAKTLCLNEVNKICQMHLNRSISLATWQKIKEIACKHQFDDVVESIFSFLSSQISGFAFGNDIFLLTEDEILKICNYKCPSMQSFSKADACLGKFVLVFRWVQSNMKERLPKYGKLLELLDPNSMEKNSTDLFLTKMEYEGSTLVHYSTTVDFIASVPCVQPNSKSSQNCRVLNESSENKEEKSTSSKNKEKMPVSISACSTKGFGNEYEENVETYSCDPDSPVIENLQDKDYIPPQKYVGKKHNKLSIRNTLRKCGEKVFTMKEKRGRRRPNNQDLENNVSSSSSPKPVESLHCLSFQNSDVQTLASEPIREHGETVVTGITSRKCKRGHPRKNTVKNNETEGPPESPLKPVTKKRGRKASTPRRIESNHVKRSIKKGPYQCTYTDCEYIAPRKGMLRDHLNGHEGIKAYLCSICEKTFLTMKHLKRHQKMHTAGKQYMCERCTFSSYRQDKLKDHISRRHPDVQELSPKKIDKVTVSVGTTSEDKTCTTKKNYNCEKCLRTFQSSQALACHMKGHGRTRPYLCEICGFSSVHFRSITLHRRRHSGKVFRCDQEGCSYTNVFKERFIDHVNKHAGIKNHICSVCGKAFAARKHMQRHEKSHSNTDTFACDECNYKSGRKDKLNEHIRRHHPYIAVAIGLLSAEALETISTKTPPKSRKHKTKVDNKSEEPMDNPLLSNVHQPISFITQLPSTDLSSIMIQPQVLDGQHLVVGPDAQSLTLGSTPVTLAPINLNADQVPTTQSDDQPAYIDNLALYALSNYTWGTIQTTS